MLLISMTRSLIRLDSIVRTSLNTGLNDKVHDETRVKADVRTNVDDDGITKGYNDRRSRARTETDRDITRDDRDEIVITKGYEDITKGYNEREREDDSITNSYSGYNEKLWSYNEKL